MTAKNDSVVFVVNVRDFDIECAWLVSEPSKSEKMVKTKHRGRAFAVPSMLCHDTLDSAKEWLLKYIESRSRNIKELEYDSDNFWVA